MSPPRATPASARATTRASRSISAQCKTLRQERDDEQRDRQADHGSHAVERSEMPEVMQEHFTDRQQQNHESRHARFGRANTHSEDERQQSKHAPAEAVGH